MILFIQLATGNLYRRPSLVGGPAITHYDLEAIALPIQEIHYSDAYGNPLYGWLILQDDSQHKPTLIFLHGSAGILLNYLLPIERLYNALDVNIFACEYPGTGMSPGETSLESTVDMTDAAYEYLATLEGIEETRIVFYGLSMGAYFAYQGALVHPGHAIIIDSGVTSSQDVVRQTFAIPIPETWVASQPFEVYTLVAQITDPILFLHSQNDQTLMLHDTKKLYETANAPKEYLWIDGAGHSLLLYDSAVSVVTERIAQFLDEEIGEK
jgi:pimeloyl-ACP methyl ester carboxylesterase